MKYYIISVVAVSLFLSCSKQSELSKKYNCNVIKIENSKTIIDFNEKFKLTTPSDWKTELYFNEFESEVFAADTIKQLTESFIFGASFNQGTLNFDDEFHKKTDSILIENNLQIINSGTHSFQNKPSYWYVAKGLKNGFTYHQFNLTAKQSENTYFNASSEIYGDNNIDERICESISILEKVEFL